MAILNENSTFAKFALQNHKTDGRGDGSRVYKKIKHLGSFDDVFKGVSDVGVGGHKITLVDTIPLSAPIYSINLKLCQSNGSATAVADALDIENADVTQHKELYVEIGVLPGDILTLCHQSGADAINYFQKYIVPNELNNIYNLAGCKLVSGYTAGLLSQYSKTLQTATADQTFSISGISYDASKILYGGIKPCVELAYNNFLKREANGDVSYCVNNNDLNNSHNFYRISPLITQSEDTKEAYNSGTGCLYIASIFRRADNKVQANNAQYTALFGAGFRTLQVIFECTYGENLPLDNDRAYSYPYFIKG